MGGERIGPIAVTIALNGNIRTAGDDLHALSASISHQARHQRQSYARSAKDRRHKRAIGVNLAWANHAIFQHGLIRADLYTIATRSR